MFVVLFILFFKQKTAYEMRISDWSSDVCSSDLPEACRTAWAACWRDSRATTTARFWSRKPAARSWPTTWWSRPATAACCSRPRRSRRRSSSWGPAASATPTDRKSTRLTPVTNAHLVCRLLLAKKKIQITENSHQTIKHSKKNQQDNNNNQLRQ